MAGKRLSYSNRGAKAAPRRVFGADLAAFEEKERGKWSKADPKAEPSRPIDSRGRRPYSHAYAYAYAHTCAYFSAADGSPAVAAPHQIRQHARAAHGQA